MNSVSQREKRSDHLLEKIKQKNEKRRNDRD